MCTQTKTNLNEQSTMNRFSNPIFFRLCIFLCSSVKLAWAQDDEVAENADVMLNPSSEFHEQEEKDQEKESFVNPLMDNPTLPFMEENHKREGGKALNLFHVCREDVARLCPKTMKISCVEQKKNRDQVKDAMCKAWLSDQAQCFQEAVIQGCVKENIIKTKLTKYQPRKKSLNRCLIETPLEKISNACSDTAFYKSLERARQRWDRYQTRQDKRKKRN